MKTPSKKKISSRMRVFQHGDDIRAPQSIFPSRPDSGLTADDRGLPHARRRLKHIHDKIDNSLVPEPMFSHLSCLHRDIPARFTSCLVLLDRLLSVELTELEEREVNQQHRSSLSMKLCASKQKEKQHGGRRVFFGSQKSTDQCGAPSLTVQLKNKMETDSRSSTWCHLQHSLSTGSERRRAQVRDQTEKRRGQGSCPGRKRRYHSHSESNSPGDLPQTLTLQEALELFRPDFISRSQGRLRRMKCRARSRRGLQTPELELIRLSEEPDKQRKNCTTPDPLSDNLFKPRERFISGREMQLRSRRMYKLLPEVTKKKEDERRKVVTQTNRLRAEVYKKKLLDQILQR